MLPNTKRIFVSNRLPFSVNSKTGELSRGSGGLVSALLGVSLDQPFAWFGFETSVRHAQVLSSRAQEVQKQMICEPVLLQKEIYDRYYDGFSNDVIWPLFHYEGQLALFKRENWEAYVAANKAMAEAIARKAAPNDTVWIHDFHFLMLPQFLRELAPHLKIGFFLHIPFPSAEIFRQLPVREEILRSLIQCDLVGFHEHSYLRHFIVSLKTVLGIDSSFFKAQIGEHTLHLGVYPISVDTQSLKEKASSPAIIKRCQKYLEKSQVDFLILGVDRLDYTKGLELKLRGFKQALQKYPELNGKIGLLQVAVPTRQKVPYYMKIKKDIDQLVGSINGSFAKPDYNPVHYIFNSVTETDLLALYRRANAALVTSKRDGMNLVSMEYVICQDLERPGVLILSEFAGAASLLSEALIINPWDEDEVAESIYRAYTMSLEERRSRLENLQNVLSGYSATKWAESFLKDLDESNPREGAKIQSLSVDAAHWPNEISSKIRQAKSLRFILDYDGTLVAFAKKPQQAHLLSETRDLVRRLSALGEVIILSGRSQAFLDSQFSEMPVALVAEHGAFCKLSGGQWESRIYSDISTWYPEVERIMASYCERVPFSFVEHKEAALVWHFRESPEAFADFQARKLDDELQIGLSNKAVSIVMGHRIVEAKAQECNKGNFVRWLLQRPEEDPSALTVALGDDRTDEDMFMVLSENDLSVKVGPGPTAAKFRLASQAGVMKFLTEVAELREEKHINTHMN